MKKKVLLDHLKANNCVPTGRQRGSHAGYVNLVTGEKTSVPIHPTIADLLARKICKELGIPPVKNN